MLGHQCPLETVSVGSEGALSHRRLWREKGRKCGSTRAAHGRAALRISKHLLGGGSGGLAGYGAGKEQLGGVQSAPFLGHRAEPLSRILNYQVGVRILINHRAEGCQALPGPFLVLRARCAEGDGEAGPVGTGTSSATQPIRFDASELDTLQTLVIQLQIKCALEEIAMTWDKKEKRL